MVLKDIKTFTILGFFQGLQRMRDISLPKNIGVVMVTLACNKNENMS